jgi:hypothetical protein
MSWLRPDADNSACRRDYRSQLHPVRGRDIPNWIRSDSFESDRNMSKSAPPKKQRLYVTLELQSAKASDKSACRRDYRSQLQPVLGRDLSDRIRSERIDGSI